MSKEEFKNLKAITAWDNGNDVELMCKINGKRGVKVIRNFQWYFAMKREDEAKSNIRQIINEFYDRGVVIKIEEFNDEFVKIYCDRTNGNKDIDVFQKALKYEGCTLYEADLSGWKRFITDNHIEIEGDLDIIYFDIETDDTKGGIMVGRDEILTWAGVNSKGKIFFYDGAEDTQKFPDVMPENREKRLLLYLVRVLNQHDLIAGWNSSNFDIPYVKMRMKIHGIEFNWKKKIHIDMMQRCARIYSYNMFNIGLKGFSLNEVARVFLGEKKIEHTEGIKEMFDNNRELLKEYNIKDVTLLRDLDTKLLVTDLMIKECQWTGAFLDRFFIGELLDNYILRRTQELGTFQFSRPDSIDKQRFDKEDDSGDSAVSVRGGYVMSPKVGLFENVRLCDFKSLYPSIIVGFNIGRDSLNQKLSDDGYVAMCNFLNIGQKNERKIEEVPFEEWWSFLKSEKQRLDPDDLHIQAANNVYFSREKVSFIGALVNELLEKRAMWKAQAKGMSPDDPEYISIQQSQGLVKEMANSMFGITGDRNSRYFNLHVTEAITLTGQFMNRISSYFAQQKGYETIYGDTDSIFIPVTEDKDMDILINDINANLKDFLDNDIRVIENIVLLQYEKKFSKLIMLDKKRYSGRMVLYDGNPTDKIFTRGLENVKKNTIALTRRSMVKLLNTIVTDGISKEDAKKWMIELRTKVLHEEVPPEDLLILTRVSKSPDKYKSKQTHVRLAERLINEGKLQPISEDKKGWGTRLNYIAIWDEASQKQEGVILSEYQGNWDRKYYWDVQVYAPIRRVLEAVWPEEDWSIYSIADAERQARAEEREKKRALRLSEEEKKKKIREDKKKASEEKKKLAEQARELRKAKLLEKKSKQPSLQI